VNQYLRQITEMFYSLNTAVFKKQQRESITNKTMFQQWINNVEKSDEKLSNKHARKFVIQLYKAIKHKI